MERTLPVPPLEQLSSKHTAEEGAAATTTTQSWQIGAVSTRADAINSSSRSDGEPVVDDDEPAPLCRSSSSTTSQHHHHHHHHRHHHKHRQSSGCDGDEQQQQRKARKARLSMDAAAVASVGSSGTSNSHNISSSARQIRRHNSSGLLGARSGALSSGAALVEGHPRHHHHHNHHQQQQQQQQPHHSHHHHQRLLARSHSSSSSSSSPVPVGRIGSRSGSPAGLSLRSARHHSPPRIIVTTGGGGGHHGSSSRCTFDRAPLPSPLPDNAANFLEALKRHQSCPEALAAAGPTARPAAAAATAAATNRSRSGNKLPLAELQPLSSIAQGFALPSLRLPCAGHRRALLLLSRGRPAAPLAELLAALPAAPRVFVVAVRPPRTFSKWAAVCVGGTCDLRALMAAYFGGGSGADSGGVFGPRDDPWQLRALLDMQRRGFDVGLRFRPVKRPYATAEADAAAKARAFDFALCSKRAIELPCGAAVCDFSVLHPDLTAALRGLLAGGEV